MAIADLPLRAAPGPPRDWRHATMRRPRSAAVLANAPLASVPRRPRVDTRRSPERIIRWRNAPLGELLRGVLIAHSAGVAAAGTSVGGRATLLCHVGALGEVVACLRPDALILASASWVTTFHHCVSGAMRLAGAPLPPEPDEPGAGRRDVYPGDPGLARALVAAGRAAGVPAQLTEDETLPWDDAGAVPLSVLAPRGAIAVVPISLCRVADLAETLRWGRAIGVAVRSGRHRAILAVTGAPRWRLLRAPVTVPALAGTEPGRRAGLRARSEGPASSWHGTPASPAPGSLLGRALVLLAGALSPPSGGEWCHRSGPGRSAPGPRPIPW